MNEPDGFTNLENLKPGDEIWIVIGDENWLKRIVEIVPEPDGTFSLTLEDAIEAF